MTNSSVKGKVNDTRKLFVNYIAISFSLYQLYAILFGAVDPLIHRPIHLGFTLALVYLIYLII